MKKNTKMQFTALILILVFLCAIFISCAEKNDANTKSPDNINANDANNNSANAAADSVSVEEAYPYPEYDFKGAVINVLARKDGWYEGSQDLNDLTVEEINGEVLNDAVYNRTKKVEEKYNFSLKIIPVADPVATVQKSIKAGDDEYQMIQEKLMFMSQTLAPQNYLRNLQGVLSLNLDAPWYNQNAIKDLSINKKITVLAGDMTINDKGGVIMAVFSKKLSEQYGLENLYNTVKDGKWTLDKLYELMLVTTVDLNGDGKLTLKDDQWGLAIEDYGGWMFSAASGNRLATLDENGIPYMTHLTEKNISDYERIKKIMYEKFGRVVTPEDEEHVRVFVENRCFISVDMLSSIAMLRGMDDDFGIIPLPKQDETQKDYITTISPWVSRFFAIPSTCQNTEMVGAVIDAMSRESGNTVMPAYYNNLLNQKIARDEESIEMLKNIFDSVIYDIGSVFNWGNIWDEQHHFFAGKKEDYISYHEKIAGKIQSALDKTIETMQQFD